MTRAEQLAELEKKAKALRERAAKVDAQKRRILRAEAKARRAAETRAKIIWGAAFLAVVDSTQGSSIDAVRNAVLARISPKDRAFLDSLRTDTQMDGPFSE